MATSVEAITRLQMQTIAQGVSGLSSARIKLGLVDIGVNANLLQNMLTQGPYLVILPANVTEINTTTGLHHFSVSAELYFGLAGDTSQDFTSAEDLVYSPTGLIQAWKNTSNYSNVCAAPQKVQPRGEPTVERDFKPLFCMYQIDLDFIGSK